MEESHDKASLALGEGAKKKYSVRNGEFCWYFKFPLMLFEFYNGFRLRFSIEELVKLRSLLLEIQKFLQHYNSVAERAEKSDHELAHLENEACKFPLFLREAFVLSKKNAYVAAWKELADPVIKSVPIVNMELKARKPEELLELLEEKKRQQEEERLQGESRFEEASNSKRKRKQNPFYNNEEMTLITEETFGLKSKKRRKGNNDTEYRNNAVNNNAKKQARSQREDF